MLMKPLLLFYLFIWIDLFSQAKPGDPVSRLVTPTVTWPNMEFFDRSWHTHLFDYDRVYRWSPPLSISSILRAGGDLFETQTTVTLDWRYQAMDWNTRRRVCSAREGQKRVESLGVCVSDLRPSVMRMDLGKLRPCANKACIQWFDVCIHKELPVYACNLRSYDLWRDIVFMLVLLLLFWGPSSTKPQA